MIDIEANKLKIFKAKKDLEITNRIIDMLLGMGYSTTRELEELEDYCKPYYNIIDRISKEIEALEKINTKLSNEKH